MKHHTDPGPSAAPIVCDRCGKSGAMRLGDQALCRDCYFACNSCCLEFGGDDIWQPDDDTAEGPPHPHDQ